MVCYQIKYNIKYFIVYVDTHLKPVFVFPKTLPAWLYLKQKLKKRADTNRIFGK